MHERLQLILAATDFSPPAALALQRAARLAREHDARLVLLHAVDPGAPRLAQARIRAGELYRGLLHEVRERLGEAATALEREYSIRTQVAIEQGAAAQRLARAAQRLRADLIVVGAHGRHALLDAVLGTTAQRVLRLARQPVLIVRTHSRAPYEEVLLPCDESPSAEAAVRLAQIAFPRARCILLNVANAPFEGMLAVGGADRHDLARYRRETRHRAEARLRALAAGTGLAERSSIRVVRGYVPGQVLRLAKDLQHGLIVMGAYGRSPLAALLLGSVSAHVAAEAPCDVLLVKATRRPARRGARRQSDPAAARVRP